MRGLQHFQPAKAMRAPTIFPLAVCLLSVFIFLDPARAQGESVKPKLETLVRDLDRPWGMSALPDQSLLISERKGQLRRWHQGKLSKAILGLPAVFDAGQGGLLDVLAAPDFAQTGRLWISYSAGTERANHTAVSELTLDMQTNPPSVRSTRLLFAAVPDKSGGAHFGGRLLMHQNRLLLTLGDGFDYREAAQDPRSQLGKVVAIDIDAAAPAQIFSSGHRNAQGLAWDSARNILWAHEHGPQGGDELNVLIAGKNYGWPAVSAGLDYTGALVSPFTEHANFAAASHTWTPSIAPSGMVLYEGAMFPEWQGNLLITALAGRALHRLVVDGQNVELEEKLLLEQDRRWRDIEVAADGSIYLLSDGGDAVLMRMHR
jgi:aldose sugar dehydrogenase